MAKVPEPVTNPAMEGERPMSIARRMIRERERMLGMTDEERAWRKKWLKAQILAPEEPVWSESLYKEMYNPIRRFYKWPWNRFQDMMEPVLSPQGAFLIRHFITKGAMGTAVLYWIYYHLKYGRMDWMKKSGWKIMVTRTIMYPDNKDLNALYKVKGNQFYVNGFDKSPI
ncbi:PREDICTED: uncharacterized protein LOC106748499 [Dinoponera quadriceps]|uniref:Uncharacterized protein LOC106748499 n=1 Tax=Dinoponera quadriceps TaxID=609295 RepID=A0A6P3XVJ4_DINQU|nr:PREDICTED: uncharacterized protein LOC106748499 [Dinoponera quadriceps]